MDIVFGDENLISLIFDHLEEKDSLAFSHSFSKARKVCGEDYVFELLQEWVEDQKINSHDFIRKRNFDEEFFRKYIKAGMDRYLIADAMINNKLTSQMIENFFQDGLFQNKNGDLDCDGFPVSLCICGVFERLFDTLTKYNIILGEETCGGWHEKGDCEAITSILWDFYKKTIDR
jgi:hypothetical protein